MEDRIDIRRVGRERLSKHQSGFAMLMATRVLEFDVGGECRVAGGRLPYIAERVALAPDVVAARAHRVDAGVGLVRRFGGAAHGTDIAHVDEHANRLGLHATG